MALSDDRRNGRHRTYAPEFETSLGWAIRGGTVLLRAAMYSPCIMSAGQYLVLVHLKVTLNKCSPFQRKAAAKAWKSD